MFKDIKIKKNNSENLVLFDTHDIVINRGNNNNAEIVIHPCRIGSVNIRFAKEPYECKLYLANGKTKKVQLWDESDWGEIQYMNYEDEFKDGIIPEDWDKHIGWGNDEDGHVEIVKVEMLDGVPHGTEIPLEEFKQDVADFIIYFEA